MDLELFKKLGAGAKFDFKRFKKDAEKLKIIKERLPKLDDALISLNQATKLTNIANCSDNETDRGIQLLDGISSNTSLKHLKKKSLAELKSQHEEKVNGIRKSHSIHVIGTDLSDPFERFDQLTINSVLLNNIKKMGYIQPTPIQMQAIPLMLQRREILACAPTGSGKTAAFIVPLLHYLKEPMRKGFRVVVVAPTRELAKQTYREFFRLSEGLNFKIYMIDKVGIASKRFGPSSSKKFDILVTTPNRLVYLLKQSPPSISLSSVEWLIIDESDKLFEAGKTGFRDQLAVIYQSCDAANIRRAMFSATYTHAVEKWCQLNLDNLAVVFIGERNTATDMVEQQLLFVGNEDGKLLAFRDFVRKGFSPPVLVFVQSKDRAKQIFYELIYDGINVDVIHAGRTQLQRDNVVKSFREGKIWVLITTELMGRGIDFKGVNIVINFDLPDSPISYIHRVGRTGRAGRPGKSITYFTENDSQHLSSIASVMKQAGCPIPDYLLIKKKKRKFFDKQGTQVPFKKNKKDLNKSDNFNKSKDRFSINKHKTKNQNTHDKSKDRFSINKHKTKKQKTHDNL